MKYYLIILAESLLDFFIYGINDRGYCYPALSLGFKNTLTEKKMRYKSWYIILDQTPTICG